MIAPSPIGKRIAPRRFILFGIVAAVAMPLAMLVAGWRQGAMIGFDVAALIFLLSCTTLLRTRDAAEIRRQAHANDANRPQLLALTGLITLVILIAIGAEVAQRGAPAPATVALIVSTLALSWLFGNVVYALHYAHLFYGGDAATDRGGLDFPGTTQPDYADFLYFSATLGMTSQTSDVGISSSAVRRVVTCHAVVAFAFNIGVLAFTINVLGGS